MLRVLHGRGFGNIKNYEYGTLLDPMRDPLGAGFHTLQSITAVGSGGILGKGWLQGTQTQLAFIPERSTDFVFSGYAEEFGFFGSLLLILLYAGITLRGLWISIGAPTDFARLLGGNIVHDDFYVRLCKYRHGHRRFTRRGSTFALDVILVELP